MANALTLRFGSDVDGAKAGIASLAASIASNMATISGTALTAGKSLYDAGQTTVTTLTAIKRASDLVVPSLGLLAAAYVSLKISSAAIAAINARLDEYVKIGEQAAAGGVNPEFFQRQAKAADEYRIAIDDVAKSLANLRRDTAASLGGSGFEKRLDELQKAGNFSGNSGVGAFKAANTDEERYRAIIKLIDEAMQKGERLAALDLAKRFLPPAMLDQLRANADYLKQMQESADRISAKELVSNEDVARAISLKNRLEDAEQVLSSKFKPVQDDLARLGLSYKENWVGIVEIIASAVSQMQRGYSVLSELVKLNPIVASTMLRIANPLLGVAVQAALPLGGGASSASPEDSPEMAAAKNALRSGLSDPNRVRLAGEQATNVAYGARRDTSKNPTQPTARESLDQIEALINRMERQNAELEVEGRFIGQNNAEREKGVAIARAEAAARAAGRDLTSDEVSKINGLAEAHFNLSKRIMDVEQAQRQAAEASRYFGDLAANSLADMILEGKSANDIFQNLSKTLARAALQGIFTGQGPLAGLLGTAPAASAGSNAVGGIAGLFTGLFRAGGGDVRAGQAVTVGELGREVFVPDQDGKVYPIGQARGAPPIVFNTTLDARGADPTAAARMERSLQTLAARQQTMAKQLQSTSRYQTTGVY